MPASGFVTLVSSQPLLLNKGQNGGPGQSEVAVSENGPGDAGTDAAIAGVTKEPRVSWGRFLFTHTHNRGIAVFAGEGCCCGCARIFFARK